MREQPRISFPNVAESAPNLFKSLTLEVTEDALCQLSLFSCLPGVPLKMDPCVPQCPRSDATSSPNNLFLPGARHSVTHCFHTVSSLPQLVLHFPHLFLVLKFRNSMKLSVKLFKYIFLQSAKRLSLAEFPQSPGTAANETAEQKLIYHSVITISGHERAIPGMNYGSILCPMHPVRQGKQMLPCLSCQPPKRLTFVILINS